MSDLPGTIGSMPGGSVRMGNGASRASQGPVPVQTHQPSSGVRTPTEIMRQRRDREARKKAEQEAKDLEQEAARRRVQQEQYQQPRQTQPQPQYYAANNGARAKPVQRRATVSSGMPPAPGLQHGIGTTPGFSSGYVQASPANAGPRTPNQQQHGQPPLDVPLRTGSYKQPTGQTAPPNQQGAPQPQPQQQSRRSTFPHAFERWETLSSHWEGLTSYWLRKLQQNGEALDHNTVNQQMARQITDLSAAGANLFHAVVELQRLRASSERKFQRWFFETRAEQERAREVQAELERQLQAERQNRTDTLSSWQRFESEKLNNSELLKEMRRELQISKEEARRAWEELGRREQEERDRTRSLQDGHPTLVGGVQVVPMIQGFGTRQNSANRPPTREGPYPGGPGPSNMGGQSEESAAREAMDPAAAGQYYEAGSTSSTETDPFPEDKEKHPMISPSTAAEGSSQTNPSHFYQQNPSAVFHPRPTAPEPREGAYNPSAGSDEPEDDEYPQYGRDVLYPPTLSDESDDFASFDSSPYLSTGQVPLDYSGSGWGPGWDPMTPRYRHPNAPNLSVVLEEDERSRTTPSRASPASRSLASRSVASRSLH